MKYIYIILPFFLSCLISCEKRLDEPSTVQIETVNGFIVKWRSQVTETQKLVARGILNDMVYVEGGNFTMGATPEQVEMARDNETPNQYVNLSDFYICKYEVTDNQFNIITGKNVSASERYPSRISFDEYKLFITCLSDITSIQFSLPTEAQWEYAARGGKYSMGYIYPGSNNLDEVRSTSFSKGSDKPNELGIYNMADLKSEWCEDYYESFEATYLMIHDRLISQGKYHVVRGGNFLCITEDENYFPRSHSQSSLSYNIASSFSITNNELDCRLCRITSRTYSYDINWYFIGCRLVINTSSLQI